QGSRHGTPGTALHRLAGRVPYGLALLAATAPVALLVAGVTPRWRSPSPGPTVVGSALLAWLLVAAVVALSWRVAPLARRGLGGGRAGGGGGGWGGAGRSAGPAWPGRMAGRGGADTGGVPDRCGGRWLPAAPQSARRPADAPLLRLRRADDGSAGRLRGGAAGRGGRRVVVAAPAHRRTDG